MPEDLIKSDAELLEMTADIVSAYVSNNPVPVAELARIIADTSAAGKLADRSVRRNRQADGFGRCFAVGITRGQGVGKAKIL
jgi:predicted transcriptional regulator